MRELRSSGRASCWLFLHLLLHRLHEAIHRRAQLIHQRLELFVAGAAFERLAQRLLGVAQRGLRVGNVAVLDEDRHLPQPRRHVAQVVVGLGAHEIPEDRAQAEIDAGLRRELLRRDGERVERGDDVRLRVGIEREIAALLDQRLRQRLGEDALAAGAARTARSCPRCRPRRGRSSVIVTSAPAQGWSVRSLMVWPTPFRVRACGSTSAKSGGAVERMRLVAGGGLAFLAREGRLRFGHAVIVLELVGRAAASRGSAAPGPWRARWSAACRGSR